MQKHQTLTLSADQALTVAETAELLRAVADQLETEAYLARLGTTSYVKRLSTGVLAGATREGKVAPESGEPEESLFAVDQDGDVWVVNSAGRWEPMVIGGRPCLDWDDEPKAFTRAWPDLPHGTIGEYPINLNA